MVAAKAVILATGPCGRLGLPASGYLYGTYENPTNAGDGYSMAFHAGAELSGIECFQINPLIKDYNGPACAYVANPFGGYQVNAQGERFVDSDYWSGQMMSEVKNEIESARGPIYLKVSHLPDETLSTLEGILHTTERPTRGTFHANRGHDYRTHDIEMHISEIGLCSGHSASGVWVDEHARTTVSGLYAAGDLACVPHNYMIGAFVYGDLAGSHAASTLADVEAPQQLPDDQIAAAHELIYRPLRHPDGPPQTQVEYKLRRFVNDYVAPPKTAAKLSIAVQTFDRMRDEIAGIGATTPHELMRAVEVSFIRDCAEMAARSSLTRTESRWGLYHDRSDTPERDDVDWRYHLNLRKTADGDIEFFKRPVAPYFVPVPGFDELPSGETEPIAVRQPDLVGGQAPASEVSRVRDGAAAHNRRRRASLPCWHSTSPRLRSLRRFSDRPRCRSASDSRRCAHRTPARRVRACAACRAERYARRSASRRSRRHPRTRRGAARPGPRPPTLLDSVDPVVRGAAVYVLSSRRAGDAEQYRRALADKDHRVRIEAVRALVSVDDDAGVAAARSDANREVRIGVANGLGTLGTGADTVRELIEDPDPLVRAAALAAMGSIGWDDVDVTTVEGALAASAWQIRQGAARALAGAPSPSAAVPPLSRALSDPHLDVRKAAVLSLTRWASSEDSAREALAGALDDGDADVRAYARRRSRN